MSEQELHRLVTPGRKVRLVYPEAPQMNKIVHILTIVDGDRVVSKTWYKRWVYEVQPMYWYRIHLKDNMLEKA